MTTRTRMFRGMGAAALLIGVACQASKAPEPVEHRQSGLIVDKVPFACVRAPCDIPDVSFDLAGGVETVNGVRLILHVLQGGTVTLLQGGAPPVPLSGLGFLHDPGVDAPHVWDIEVPDDFFTGAAQVCIRYDPNWVPPAIPEVRLELQQFDGVGFVKISRLPNDIANIICGSTTSLSQFVIAYQVPVSPGPPTIGAPDRVSAEATGPSGASVSFTALASDFQGNFLPVTCNPPSGATFPLGNTVSTCVTAEDANGLSTSGSIGVTVRDTVPPVLTELPVTILVLPTGPTGVVVSYVKPRAEDVVDGPVPVVCAPPSESLFPIGTTVVTCSATDSAGNTASASFTVIVPKPNGDTCAEPVECGSHHCVDGVCCEEACGDGVNDCQACSQAAGGTADGSCTAVTDGRTCGTSGTCRVAAVCSPTSKVCPDNTPVAAGTLCDAPPNLCDWIQPTCDPVTLSCPAHAFWETKDCKPMTSWPQSTDLGDGQDADGGVTVTPDAPLSGEVSIAVRKLTAPPTCPSSTPAEFKAGSPAKYWQIETSPPGTALLATVCINFLSTNLSPQQQCDNLHLYHHGDTSCTSWGTPIENSICNTDSKLCGTGTPPTMGCDHPGTICGHVDHFSPFAVFAPEPAEIPSVIVPAPMVVGATTAAGAVVTYAASAHDAHDGDFGPQCAPASGSTFPLGTTTVVCSATNSLGFRGEASFTVRVQVQAPTDGRFFLQPINADGSSIFKRGSTIPVKFRLTGASAGITNLAARLLVAKVSNGVAGTDVEPASNAAPDGGNLFRYDCGQYIFNLSTKGMTTGTWSLRADLGDGVDHVIRVSLR